MSIISRLFVVFFVVFALFGCQKEQGLNPVLSEAQALSLAQEALTALNEGDYEGFSAGWSDALRSGISEAAFLDFRAVVLEASGQFVSIDNVRLEPGQNQGVVRYEFDCTFEKEPAVFVFSLREESTEIDGVFFDSENFRALQ